jgi:hypothetical protein
MFFILSYCWRRVCKMLIDKIFKSASIYIYIYMEENMKKIIYAIILTTISLSSFAEPSFTTAIPQPDYISSDWDGDGIINSEDPDDDNDGVNDEVDSIPFGKDSRDSTPPLTFNYFTSNKITIDQNESFNLSWSFENPRKLSLYNDLAKTNLISDVTGLNSLSINNVTSDKTFYLDYITDTASFNIFTWRFNGKSCGSYSPLASMVNSGNSFTQNRTCTNNYVSSQPNSKSNSYSENRQSIGTKISKECDTYENGSYQDRYDASSASWSTNFYHRYYWKGAYITQKRGNTTGFVPMTYGGYQYTSNGQRGGPNYIYDICREPI